MSLSGGAVPPSITPMPQQVTVQDNYIDFADGNFDTWAQQYLPELYEQEVERYGNRTLSGFLRMVGAEMPLTSDQVIWTEQNRLHVAYDTVKVQAKGGAAASTVIVTITPGPNNPATSGIRVGNTILISDIATGLKTTKALVTELTNTNGYVFDAVLYEETSAQLAARGGIIGGTALCKLFVYGSEFPKGSNGMSGAIGS